MRTGRRRNASRDASFNLRGHRPKSQGFGLNRRRSGLNEREPTAPCPRSYLAKLLATRWRYPSGLMTEKEVRGSHRIDAAPSQMEMHNNCHVFIANAVIPANAADDVERRHGRGSAEAGTQPAGRSHPRRPPCVADALPSAAELLALVEGTAAAKISSRSRGEGGRRAQAPINHVRIGLAEMRWWESVRSPSRSRRHAWGSCRTSRRADTTRPRPMRGSSVRWLASPGCGAEGL
jgi:hypothetical protein